MSFAVLEEKIKALPKAAQQEVSQFVDFMYYKFNIAKDTDIEQFNVQCAKMQAEAKKAGMMEQDITTAIQDVRRAHKEKHREQEAIA